MYSSYVQKLQPQLRLCSDEILMKNHFYERIILYVAPGYTRECINGGNQFSLDWCVSGNTLTVLNQISRSVG